MFTFNDALNAYRASLYAGAELDTKARIGERSLPIIGGAWSRIQQGANAMWRVSAVITGFIFGHAAPLAPPAPEVPEAFRGTDLGTAFNDAWRLKTQTIDARVESIHCLLHLDIKGWQQHRSVAAYARTKETNVTFPDERTVRTHRSGAESFAGNLGNLTANVPIVSDFARGIGQGVLRSNI